MKGRLLLVAGLATGYVLGSRAGRSAYENLRDRARSVAKSPQVQDGLAKAKDVASDQVPKITRAAKDAAGTAKDKAQDAAGAAKDAQQSAGQKAGQTSGSTPTTAPTEPRTLAEQATGLTDAPTEVDESTSPTATA